MTYFTMVFSHISGSGNAKSAVFVDTAQSSPHGDEYRTKIKMKIARYSTLFFISEIMSYGISRKEFFKAYRAITAGDSG